MHEVFSSALLISPPQWLVLHHFGGSFSLYGVSISSLRGGWSLTAIYLLSSFNPPTPPPLPPNLNHFLSLGPPLVGKFSAIRGIRVTMHHRGKYGQRGKGKWWEKKKEIFKD